MDICEVLVNNLAVLLENLNSFVDEGLELCLMWGQRIWINFDQLSQMLLDALGSVLP